MIFPKSIWITIRSQFFRHTGANKTNASRADAAETRSGAGALPSGDKRSAVYSGTDSILVSTKNSTLTIFLNRPDVLNAIDIQMAQTLLKQLKQAATDPAIRVVMITGNGRAFCSGGDLKFALEANPEKPGNSFQVLTAVLHECIEIIRSMQKPVIAAINGPAAGAGLFLALACDLRLMADSAYLKASNTSFGLTIPASGTYTLPRLIGLGRALEMVMLDLPVSAKAAQSMGLVTFLAEARSFYAQAEVFAQELSQKAVHALGQVKLLMNRSFSCTLEEQLLAEQAAIVKSANHDEGREGLAAFVQKRNPEYTFAGH
jgi:2-(1,2-epoxy-1,2-dihydrophenyl)acetyl-CoA isomerase